eukprot:TRINITY_DN299_c0_g1_i2.p1 TRINITY_DN299_c0_g1~~TRINITY_DN299_c0_g1_i2.p1  ORF type:complete len:160 (-),score=23.55 TRINITY_DN299_c0_g1_i2:1532-2011(-)
MEQYEYISQSSFSLSMLTFLDLSFNFFYQPVPATFDFLPSLQTLYLQHSSYNGLANDNVFLKLTSLVSLDLSFSSLTGTIPLNFNSTSLTSLDYDWCALGSFPDVFPPLPSLKSLIISTNSMAYSIPSSFNSLTSLTNLDLHFNFISGTVPSFQDLSGH